MQHFEKIEIGSHSLYFHSCWIKMQIIIYGRDDVIRITIACMMADGGWRRLDI